MSPSPQLIGAAALAVAALSTASAALVFVVIEIHAYLQRLKQKRRRVLAQRINPEITARSLDMLWRRSSRADRQIMSEILADRCRAWPRAQLQEQIAASEIFNDWIRQLRYGGEDARVRAATWLGSIHHSRSLTALSQSAKGSPPRLKLAITVSLGRLAESDTIPALAYIAIGHTPGIPDVTVAAALAACAEGCPDTLAPLLADLNARVRRLAAWALSQVADGSVQRDLLAAAADSDAEVRARVAGALARAGGVRAEQALGLLTADPVWFVRVRALEALGRLRSPAAERVVLTRLEDGMGEVRYRAAAAYRQIRGIRGERVTRTITGSSRRALQTLISEWDRAGFFWNLVSEFRPGPSSIFHERRELLRALIAADLTRGLAHFVLVFPCVKTRLRLLSLLLENPSPALRDELRRVAEHPSCDPRVAAAIVNGRRLVTISTPVQSGRLVTISPAVLAPPLESPAHA